MTERNPALSDPNFDHDRDRYPTVDEVLDRIRDEADLPDGPIERFELTCLASGEATYRVWSARAEEPDGGYLPVRQ
jgi:hypothetical protein